jgi:hypothetical protein
MICLASPGCLFSLTAFCVTTKTPVAPSTGLEILPFLTPNAVKRLLVVCLA